MDQYEDLPAPSHPVEIAAAAFVEALKAYETQIRNDNPGFRSFGTIMIIETLKAVGLGDRPAI